MATPRLSIDSDGSSSDETVSLPSPLQEYPPVTIDSVVVNNGGTGVLHGNLTTYTVNQYIVPGCDDWNPEVVKDLVTDAVKITSDLNQKFVPNGGTNCSKLPVSKEELSGLHRRWCILISALVSLSFLTLVSTALFSLVSFHSPPSLQPLPTSPPPQNIEIEPFDMEGAPRAMSRSAWVAQPPTEPLANNTLPITRVVVCHTATDQCTTTPDCIIAVRYVQQFHIESRKWSDIAYNFLIGADGCVYVGRGWDKMGAHTKGYNNGTLGVAFIGTYIRQLPNRLQIEAFSKLMDIGVRMGKMSQNYTLVAQCQLQVTAAPGLALANNMTSWPHFDHSLPIKCTT